MFKYDNYTCTIPEHLDTRMTIIRDMFNLRNGPCLACVYRVMDARGKLGEHERSV